MAYHSYDTEQGYKDMMMGSHPGGRVTAFSIRCSIFEYLMEMVVIFIFPLGSVSLGGFPGLVYIYIISMSEWRVSLEVIFKIRFTSMKL